METLTPPPVENYFTEEHIRDIEFVKTTLINVIKRTQEKSEKLQEHITSEVMISIIYIKIFSSYLQTKKFGTLEEAWRFMNDVKGVIEKVFYIEHYLSRVEESLKTKK